MFACYLSSRYPKTNVAEVAPRVFGGLISSVILDVLIALLVSSKSPHPHPVLTELPAVCPGLEAPSAELQYVRLEPLLVGKNLLVELPRFPPVFPVVGSSSGRRFVWVLGTDHRRARAHYQRSGQG